MSGQLPDNLVKRLVRLVPSARALSRQFYQVAHEASLEALVEDPTSSALVPITPAGLDVRAVDRLAMRAWWMEGLHRVLTGRLTEAEFYRVADRLRSSGLPYHYYDLVWAVLAIAHLEWYASVDVSQATNLLSRILQDTGSPDYDRDPYPLEEAYGIGLPSDSGLYEWLAAHELESGYEWDYASYWDEVVGDQPADRADYDQYALLARRGVNAEQFVQTRKPHRLAHAGLWRLVGQYLNSGQMQPDYERPRSPDSARADSLFRELRPTHSVVANPNLHLSLHHLAPFLAYADPTTQHLVASELVPLMPPSLQRRLLSFVPERHWDVVPTVMGRRSFTLDELTSWLGADAGGDLAPAPAPLLTLDQTLPLAIGSLSAMELLLAHLSEADRRVLAQVFWDQVLITHDNVVLLERFWHELGQPPIPLNDTRYAGSPRCQRWLLLTAGRAGVHQLSDQLIERISEPFLNWRHNETKITWELMLLWREVSDRLTDDQRNFAVQRLTEAVGDFEGVLHSGQVNAMVNLALEMVDRS